MCALLGQDDPIAADPKGEWFTFEKGTRKASGLGMGPGYVSSVWRSIAGPPISADAIELLGGAGFFLTLAAVCAGLGAWTLLCALSRGLRASVGEVQDAAEAQIPLIRPGKRDDAPAEHSPSSCRASSPASVFRIYRR